MGSSRQEQPSATQSSGRIVAPQMSAIRLRKDTPPDTLIRKKSGLILDAYFSATKLQWILKHVKGARQRAGRGELAFGTVDSWLLWKLTERSRACDGSE
jgi:glycerol kinase